MSDYYDTFGSADASDVIDGYCSFKAMEEDAEYEAKKAEREENARDRVIEEIGLEAYEKLSRDEKIKKTLRMAVRIDFEQSEIDDSELILFDSFKEALSHLKGVGYGAVRRNDKGGFCWYYFRK